MNILEMQDMAFLGGQDKVDNKCNEFMVNPHADSSSTLISALIAELDSKSGSFIQLQRYQRQAAPYFKESVLRMCDTSPLSLTDLPVPILDRYSNSSRDQFLVTIFPAGNIWQDSEFLSRFVAELESVDINTTGMPPVFYALIKIIGRDGRLAALLTIGIMFILLCFDFRHAGYAIAALIPLTAGVFWMVGLMQLLGLQLTVVNVMGIPLIIGIGIDDGVHIIHRWIREGKKDIRQVFSSTGKAILLTSLTTMLGFGSLIFSIWRGFGQLGAALFIGVAACFLTTVLFLSGILGFLSRKDRGHSRAGG